MTSNFIFFLLSLSLIPYGIAVVAPTWRWLLGVTLVIGGLLSALWIQDWIVTARPGYHEGVGGALGRGFFLVVTVGFATGVVIRALTLFLASRGLRLRYVIAVAVAGFVIVPAIFIVPGLWQTWTMRPPSEACLSAAFKIKVADAAFAIPAAHMINVYLGDTSRREAYYLFSNPSLRAFCSVSDNGNTQVKATNIWWDLGRRDPSAPSICVGPIADWAKTYCSAREAAKRAKEDTIDFPLNTHVFAPDQVAMGEFGGSRSTYEDSLQAKTWPNAPVFIKSGSLTPDQRPLTFECNGNGNDYWCKTSYPWSDGASLNYSFRSGRDDVAARGSRVDAETRKFLSGFTAQR